MTVSTPTQRPRLRYHSQAYIFVTEALRLAQELLGREGGDDNEEASHISGRELLDGARVLGLRQFGMMAPSVFRRWGVTTTEDFGRIVFEMIEMGELRKTERDQLSDFRDVYNFHDVFVRDYRIDTSKVFHS